MSQKNQCNGVEGKEDGGEEGKQENGEKRGGNLWEPNLVHIFSYIINGRKFTGYSGQPSDGLFVKPSHQFPDMRLMVSVCVQCTLNIIISL